MSDETNTENVDKPQVAVSSTDWLAFARANGIERDEVYDSRCPSHWPKDRCYRNETNEEFERRVRQHMAKANAGLGRNV